MSLEIPLSIARSDGRIPLVFAWGVSSFFGWGVYGMNLALALVDHPTITPLTALPFSRGDVVVDPLRMYRLMRVADASRVLWDALATMPTPWVSSDTPVLHPLHETLATNPVGHERMLSGRPDIGVIFFHDTRITAQAQDNARRFPLIVAGSTWAEAVLRANTIAATTTVIQGVDISLFHPAPRAGWFPGRFVIFSGGKLEIRKGQDLVLAAFRAFQRRHPEALLLTAWQSPWPNLAADAVASPSIQPPALGHDGMIDITKWAVENGIPADAVIDIGLNPQIAMPHVLREADAAIFANRCEGGTNLVAMECMACGVPTILSANTGHLDLLGHDAALPLCQQHPVHLSDVGTDGWGESSVEEMVEALETLWRDRDSAAALGARGAAAMAQLSWSRQIDALLQSIAPHLR
jgi:glycosyltransferase involved in cell wall biosynthesis